MKILQLVIALNLAFFGFNASLAYAEGGNVNKSNVNKDSVDKVPAATSAPAQNQAKPDAMSAPDAATMSDADKAALAQSDKATLENVNIAFSTLSQQYSECTAVFAILLTAADEEPNDGSEQKNLVQRGADSMYAARQLGSIVNISQDDVDSNVKQMVSVFTKELKDDAAAKQRYVKKAEKCYVMSDDASAYIRDFLNKANVPKDFTTNYK